MNVTSRNPLRRSIAILSLPLLFYSILGYFASSGMFGDHPRWRGVNRGPDDFGLESEIVSFRSTDGIPLKAWWLPAAGTTRGTVIVAHGIDHTRQVMLPRAVFLVAGGYNVLLLDLRGHGESGGTVVSPGLLEARDILGALRYVRSRAHSAPAALLGVSYGAVAALTAAAEPAGFAAVISDGAFPSGKAASGNISRHILRDPHSNLLARAMLLTSLLPGAARATAAVYFLRTGIDLGPELLSVVPTVRKLHIAVLLISGEQDWIVTPGEARNLFAALPDPRKQFLTIPGAAHDTTYSTAPALYASTVLHFLQAQGM